MAGVLGRSGYHDDELHGILYSEVFPVCIWNMRSVAGAWAGIDIDWLQERILKNQKRPWTRWRLFNPGRWMIRDDWQRVLMFLRQDAKPS